MQGAAEMYLVDPKFAEQFEIAHPSPRYAAVLAAVPAQYVGSEDRLVPLVELLCSEMALAFCATGAPTAPAPVQCSFPPLAHTRLDRLTRAPRPSTCLPDGSRGI